MIHCVWEHELTELPPMEWLIENVIPLGDIGMFFGPTQSFKSFLALDVGCHVTRGKTWNGHAVHQGTVVYVAAEGQAALERRNFAWRQAHHVSPAKLCFWMQPVQIWKDDAVDDFMAAIDEQCRMREVDPPALIIFDTYHKCMAGRDEDDAGDASLAFNNLERIKECYGCTILLIHHPGRKGNHPRGSSCIDTDVDYLYSVAANTAKTLITVTQKKLRADVGETAFYLAPQVVPLPDGKANLILVGSSKQTAAAVVQAEAEEEAAALDRVRQAFGSNEWTSAQAQEAARLAKTTWYLRLQQWQEGGKISKRGHGLYVLSS